MAQKFKDHLPYLAVVAAIVLPWFFKSGYLFFTDYTVGPNVNLNWANGWLVYNLVLVLLSFLFSNDFIQKFIIAAAVFIVLLGGKKIAESFIADKRLVFLVSLFALFNPFVYDRLMYGQIGTVLAFGFFCLAIGYLLEYLNKKETRQILIAGLFTALMLQFSMHFIFFIGIFGILFGIVLFREPGKKNWQKFFKNVFWVALIIFVLNFNWLLGMFSGFSAQEKFINSSIQRQDLIAFQTSGKTGFDALKNVVMMSGFWGKDQFRYADITKFKENWGRSFLLLLPIILLGIVAVLRKSKIHPVKSGEAGIPQKAELFNRVKISKDSESSKHLVIGLIIIYLIAVILAVGVRLPAAREITYWLFDHFPFYKGLREPQKWVAMIVVVYTIFLAIGIKEIFKIKIIQANKFAAGLFIGGVIVMQAPLMLWGFAGQVKPTEYPKDWDEVNNYIVENSKFQIPNLKQISNSKSQTFSSKCEDRILFLPWHAYMSFGWIGHIVANPARGFFACPVISGTNMEWGGIYDNSQNEEGEAVAAWLASGGKTDLLSNKKFNIKYIILAKELDWQSYLGMEKNSEIELVKDAETLKVYFVK